MVGPFSVQTASTRAVQSLAVAGVGAIITTLILMVVFIVVRGMFRRQFSRTDDGRRAGDTGVRIE